MKILQGPGPVSVCVVCCPHGDELIGEVIFQHYAPLISQTPGLRLIFANQSAHSQGRRFIDTDLNRSFPGSPTGSHEEQLAAAMMPSLTDADYVLDLHTTTSNITMTPIVANLAAGTRAVLNLTDSPEIALMENGIANHALIGQVAAGVSLEFNRTYATTPAARDHIITIVTALLTGQPRPARPRRVFHITGTIPASQPLPSGAANFTPSGYPPVYPFLLGEKAYADSFHAFAATAISDEII